METDKIHQAYQKAEKKHKLPSWNAINGEFELSALELEDLPFLKQVRRAIAEKMGSYATLLESYIQPNPGSFINLEETKFFNEEDLQLIYELLKELMYLERSSTHLDFTSEEKDDAAYINESYTAWKKMKKDLEKVMTNLKKGWREELKKSKYHYFG
ncbi:MAG TPA: hypothetical protein VJB87_05605 [Candidatus Nanoarchaeia archaeon]|nr:hypothetical protein [Candidatus Nanoarchaeia archaeon]